MGILTEVIALGTVVQRKRTKFLLENKSVLPSPCRLSGEIRPETNEHNNFMYRLTKDCPFLRQALVNVYTVRRPGGRREGNEEAIIHVLYCITV
jgi:hypothetical protein